jgi:hypothetical protein
LNDSTTNEDEDATETNAKIDVETNVKADIDTKTDVIENSIDAIDEVERRFR